MSTPENAAKRGFSVNPDTFIRDPESRDLGGQKKCLVPAQDIERIERHAIQAVQKPDLDLDTAGSQASSAYFASFAPSEPPKGLEEDAFYGIAGQILRAIEPHTESDPAALLLQLLVAFGNVVGRSPYYQVEADRHAMNLFVVLVGDTSKSRKGTSWGHIKALFEHIDPQWATRITSGLSSGEGLIYAVRDPVK